MNCKQASQYLREFPDRPLDENPEEVMLHLLTCEKCQALSVESTPTGARVSGTVSRRITARIAAYLTPVTPIPSQARLIIIAVAVLVAVPSSMLAVIGDGGTHVMTPLQLAAWLIVIGAAELLLSVSLAGLMVPGSRHRANPALLALLSVVGYFWAAFVIFRSNRGSADAHEGAPCFEVGCAAATVSGLLLWRLARRGAVLSWLQTGSCVGVLSGMVGMSVLLFHCKTPEMLHVMAWHTSVLVFCILAGTFGGMIPSIFARERHT